jgi:hypothetical protein
VGVGVAVAVSVGVFVGVSVGVYVAVDVGVFIGVSVGVYVAVDVSVLIGVYVLVRGSGGRDVCPDGNKVPSGKLAEVLKATSVVVGVSVVFGASVAIFVLAITGRENACTVSTIIVFMLEITKSTMPAVGVPMETALLISFMPTTPTPHSKLTPSTAAATIPKSGR